MVQILLSYGRCSKMKIIFVLVCLTGFGPVSVRSSEDPGPTGQKSKGLPRSPVIKTKYGQVQGRILTFKGTRLQPVAVFKGIPYATPPVGSNR